MKYEILIVEDDLELAQNLRELLRDHFSCECEVALSLQQVKEYFEHERRCDLLVLDRLLPDGDGLQILRDYEERLQWTRTLVLSSLIRAEEKETGLLAGASDYLAKPFSKGELLARARNLLLTHKIQVKEDYYLTEEFVFRPSERSLYYDDKQVHLTRADTELLEYFFHHHNFLVTWKEIERCLWKELPLEMTKDAMTSQIYRLRRKMGRFGEKLQSFYDFGYQLTIANAPIKLTKII